MSIKRKAGRLLAMLDRHPAPGSRMRPGYLVIGTKRGGSTSLAEWLTEHPNVAPCRNRKGTRYFDINYGRGPAWYANRFERPSDQWQVTGEASPFYMFHPLGPKRIAEALPDVKLITVLRNPVDRLWSQYEYEVAHGNEQLGLWEALEREPERIRGERERLVADAGYDGFEYRHHAYLQRGHYAEQLQEIHRWFSPEQVLVLQSEALFADPQGQLDRVWDFLGLTRVRLDHLSPRNANGARTKIDDKSLTRLTEYYRPLNQLLYAQPGVDFRWDEDNEATVPSDAVGERFPS